jgi:hypothetical protein
MFHPAPQAVLIRASFTDHSPTSGAEDTNLMTSAYTFPYIITAWYVGFGTIVLHLPKMDDGCLASDNSVQQCLVGCGPWTLRGSGIFQKLPQIHIISRQPMRLQPKLGFVCLLLLYELIYSCYRLM